MNRSNGGQLCDTIDGPCSCGAWHGKAEYSSLRVGGQAMCDPLLSACGQWRLVLKPLKPFYGLTHDEILLSTGVLPRADVVQDMIDAAHQALDEAAGIVWPVRLYHLQAKVWVRLETTYVPVERERVK